MSTQLRADVLRALTAASDHVKAHQVGADFVSDVMRLVDGALRFLEPEQGIAEARRAVQERLESTMRLIDRLAGEDIPVPTEGRAYRAVSTARAHAVEAINHLQSQILEHGRINAAGDRVGLGKTSVSIR